LRAIFFVILCVALYLPARADVRLPKIFTDHMVLQQQLPIRIWGHADAGEAVAVDFAGEHGETVADSSGHWRVELPAMNADGKPHSLTVKGKNSIELKDVMLGEVWLAVGQSNMSRGLRYVKQRAMAERMDFADYRLFFVGLDQVPQMEEAASTKGWAPATHESMEKIFVHPTLGPYEYSEVAYEFGNHLREKLDVPVGMIAVAYGGTTASQWTPAENPAGRFDFASGKPDKGPGSMYQSMLVGIPPLSIRGVVYYQGENDAANAHYGTDLLKMLEAWRKNFERPDLPFYMAQMAQTTFQGGMLHVTQAQCWLTKNAPDTAIAPSNDLWDDADPQKAKTRLDKETGWPITGGRDPHPPNKNIIAIRLANIALAKTYGKVSGEVLGPTVASGQTVGDALRVKFDHVGKGLKTDDGDAPNWFQIAGDDKKFVKAQAKIIGNDTVELRSPDVKAPRYFRFAWNPLARHNLYNSEGLPALNYGSSRD
jgi:sialate O-acetylesterase